MVDRSSKFVATLILTSGPDALAELCRLCEGSGGAGSCGAVGEVGTVGARVTPGPQFQHQEEKTVGQKDDAAETPWLAYTQSEESFKVASRRARKPTPANGRQATLVSFSSC